MRLEQIEAGWPGAKITGPDARNFCAATMTCGPPPANAEVDITNRIASAMVENRFDIENLRRSRALQIRKMYWPEDGWPIVGDTLSAPEKFDHRHESDPPNVAGKWTQWTDFAAEETLTFSADGKLAAGQRGGSWRQKGAVLELTWTDGKAGTGRHGDTFILESNGRCYVRRNADGQVVFGVKKE